MLISQRLDVVDENIGEAIFEMLPLNVALLTLCNTSVYTKEYCSEGYIYRSYDFGYYVPS
jgi:hypothetical protein